jgi:hypothetical protein
VAYMRDEDGAVPPAYPRPRHTEVVATR